MSIRRTKTGKQPTQSRSAFTLVELLVAMAIALALAALAVLIIPSINDAQRAAVAGGQVQQWVEIAKQRAMRDRAPRGIRLIPSATNPNFVSDLVFLEQPPDLYLGSLQVPDPNPATSTTYFSRANLVTLTLTFEMYAPNPTVGQTATPSVPISLVDPAGTALLEPGDNIDIGGNIYKISTVSMTPGVGAGATATLLPTSNPTSIASINYRIIRQPRPVADDPMLLPQNIVIDLTRPKAAGFLPTTPGPIDIMFAPDGRVIGGAAAFDKLILWVRDTTVPDGQGDPALVCVYSRTGLIAGYPVDVTNFSTLPAASLIPYSFTNSGRRSSN